MPFDPRTVERFWNHVDKNGPVPKNRLLGKCYQWTGSVTHNGYARFWDGDYLPSGNPHTVRAARFIYKVLVSEIGDNLTIDHICKNRACVNVHHLEVVTQRINTLRGSGPSAQNAVKTRCKHGHELTGDNLIIRKGGRACRACARRRGREHGKRKRNALQL